MPTCTGHGNRQGLSYGQLSHAFAGRIITAQDHRLEPAEQWSHEQQDTLSHLLGAPVDEKDFTDDRLADLLYALSARPEVRQAIETEMGQHLVRAYRLPTEVGRADTTPGSVYHERAAGEVCRAVATRARVWSLEGWLAPCRADLPADG